MIIETIELSRGQIQLEEISNPDGLRLRTIRLAPKDNELWDRSYRFPQHGFSQETTHSAHHWSREAVEFLRYSDIPLMAEYLAKYPSRTVCFEMPFSAIHYFHRCEVEAYKQKLNDAIKPISQKLKVFVLDDASLEAAWVYIGPLESLEDSFESRYGSLELFLDFLYRLMCDLSGQGEFKSLPQPLETLIRSTYHYDFHSWLSLAFVRKLGLAESKFLIDLINGVPLGSLMAFYLENYSDSV